MLHLWAIAKGQEPTAYSLATNKAVTSLTTYLQQGTNTDFALVGLIDGTLIIFNLQVGKPVVAVGAHDGPLTRIVFQPHTHYVVTSGGDGYAWQLTAALRGCGTSLTKRLGIR